ncbi:hypothetical protein PR048_010363 [Dryococelus australis]|uniref:Uncharacterized protein n=1 Tax=Dryococelus australis TaxID=614101 RepID=A0ABQ9I2J1_9NEOP|nr:hypothetical protein PR048_010363 [Dryococelus australis]
MLPRTNTSGPTPKAVKHKSTDVLNYLSSRVPNYFLVDRPMKVIEVNMEIPEKTLRPAASSGTNPTRGNQVTRPGIEPGLHWWEASMPTAQQPAAPKANRVSFPAGVLPDSRTWKSYRTMSLVGSFLGDLPFPPPLHSGAITYLISSSSTLKTSIKLNTISAYARQNAASKYGNRIRLERASQKQSSNTHKTPCDRVKRRPERKINIKASERVNVDVFTQNNTAKPHSEVNI